MARRFTAASSESIQIATTAALAGLDFTHGTFAILVNHVTIAAAQSYFTTNVGAPTATANPDIDAAGVLGLWDGTNSRTGQTLTAAKNYLVGYTKATGTVTARWHSYNFSTNTWVHQAASGTSVNGVAVTLLNLGRYWDGAASEYLNGEVWAFGLWQGLVMSDSAFERLARGRWLESSPDFYEQWTDGREFGDMMTTLGRKPSKQTTRTGTSRGALNPPPGFRFGPVRRRR